MKIFGLIALIVGFGLDLSIFWIGSISYAITGVILVAVGAVALFAPEEKPPNNRGS